MRTLATSIATAFALTACDQSVDESMISSNAVSSVQFSEAQRAARICGEAAPSWQSVETRLLAANYVETTDERLSAIAQRQGSVILENNETDVIVLVGSRGGEGACIIGLPGMTPEQSLRLAGPWVAKFGAQTNAERGQALANNAVQAWGTMEDERVIFIAAYKTWDVLGEPGSAARLIYIQR